MPEKQIVDFKNFAPLELPFSRAVTYGSLLFLSGTVSMDLSTGSPILGSIEKETEQVLENIGAILKEAGSSLDCVLKTSVFLTDINDFQKMNAVYSSFFPHNPPTRTTVAIGLAGGYKVEIEVMAYIP